MITPAGGHDSDNGEDYQCSSAPKKVAIDQDEQPHTERYKGYSSK